MKTLLPYLCLALAILYPSPVSEHPWWCVALFVAFGANLVSIVFDIRKPRSFCRFCELVRNSLS